MNALEKIGTGKIFRRGPGSLAVGLPSFLVKLLGVKLDDPVELYKDGEDIILRFPKGEAPKAEAPEKGEEF